MKTVVKSTKELRELFPELPITNKFKRKIDELFAHGYSFDIRIADSWMCFTAKSEKRYKAKISYNGRGFYFKRTRVSQTCVTLENYNENPKLYRNLSENPTSRIKHGNEDWKDQYSCTHESTNPIEWSMLCKYMGELIKDKLVHVEKCWKCNGTGIIPHFMHVADGLCFECMGVGKWFEVTN